MDILVIAISLFLNAFILASYRVLVASSNGGLIETVPNAISLHSIKKNAYWKNNNPISLSFSLRDHYIKVRRALF